MMRALWSFFWASSITGADISANLSNIHSLAIFFSALSRQSYNPSLRLNSVNGFHSLYISWRKLCCRGPIKPS